MKIFISIIIVCICFIFNVSCTKSEQKGIKVTAAEFGDKWPFEKITEGYVKCEDMAVIFSTDGKNYSLNGIAKSKYNYPYPSEEGILKKILIGPKDPNNKGLVNANTDVLEKLCDK